MLSKLIEWLREMVKEVSVRTHIPQLCIVLLLAVFVIGSLVGVSMIGINISFNGHNITVTTQQVGAVLVQMHESDIMPDNASIVNQIQNPEVRRELLQLACKDQKLRSALGYIDQYINPPQVMCTAPSPDAPNKRPEPAKTGFDETLYLRVWDALPD